MPDEIIINNEEPEDYESLDSRGLVTVPLELTTEISVGNDENNFPNLVGKPVIKVTILDFHDYPLEFHLPNKLTANDLKEYAIKRIKSYIARDTDLGEMLVDQFNAYVVAKYGASTFSDSYSDRKAKKVINQVLRHLWVRENQMNEEAGADWRYSLGAMKENPDKYLKEIGSEVFVLEDIGLAAGYI